MTARTYNELFERNTYYLTLERESPKHFVVTDGDTVYYRSPDPHAAERFMRAFVARTPGAELDAWSIAQHTASYQVQLAEDRMATVYRLRPAESLDEIA